MAKNRRKAKKNTNPPNPDDRPIELPKPPKAVPPKHIPVPDMPSVGEFRFEIECFLLGLMAMSGQYINLYHAMFWTEDSSHTYPLNFYLIDFNVIACGLIVIGRRLPAIVLKQIFFPMLSQMYHATCTFYIQIATLLMLLPLMAFFCYNIAVDYGISSILILTYPILIYIIVSLNTDLVHSVAPTATEQNTGARSKHSTKISAFSHVCSMNAETIRMEMETMKSDFNMRITVIIFNSFVTAYYASFMPCYFTQPTLNYDSHWMSQYCVYTFIGCFMLYASHFFPPKYCDTFHKSALHVGRWIPVLLKNYNVPYSAWTETSVWNQGALVKQSNKLYKAEGISNAAEPGNSGHFRFYTLFRNPAAMWAFFFFMLLTLMLTEVFLIMYHSYWHNFVPILLLFQMNLRPLYYISKVYFVLRITYREEQTLIAKFTD